MGWGASSEWSARAQGSYIPLRTAPLGTDGEPEPALLSRGHQPVRGGAGPPLRAAVGGVPGTACAAVPLGGQGKGRLAGQLGVPCSGSPGGSSALPREATTCPRRPRLGSQPAARRAATPGGGPHPPHGGDAGRPRDATRRRGPSRPRSTRAPHRRPGGGEGGTVSSTPPRSPAARRSSPPQGPGKHNPGTARANEVAAAPGERRARGRGRERARASRESRGAGVGAAGSARGCRDPRGWKVRGPPEG